MDLPKDLRRAFWSLSLVILSMTSTGTFVFVGSHGLLCWFSGEVLSLDLGHNRENVW